MTEADRLKTMAASTPDDENQGKTARSKSKAARSEKEKRLAGIPKGTIDEDRILYWLWGKINPLYLRYVSKFKLLDYLQMNPDILQAFGFHPKEYQRVILSMITERHDMLNFDEFDVFLIIIAGIDD
jgi:hypothetical protein